MELSETLVNAQVIMTSKHIITLLMNFVAKRIKQNIINLEQILITL
jgi:hypothetical protein